MKVPTKDVLFKAHIQHFDIDYKTHIFYLFFPIFDYQVPKKLYIVLTVCLCLRKE